MTDQQVIRLHGPHPGFLGASARIPEELRIIANKLDGKVMKKNDSLQMINEVANKMKGIKITASDSSFLATYSENGYSLHCWRIICFTHCDETGDNKE